MAGNIGWVEIVIRSVSAVAMLFLLTRILGKKQISQLSFFEYIVGITLGELGGFISTDIEANFWHGVLALFIWFAVPLLLELSMMKGRKLRNVLEGKGTIFIEGGKVLEDNLKKERYTADELLERLRNKNVFNVADVEFAVLEASGDLSVLLKKENQPLSLKLLGVKVPTEKEPQTVILDGTILDEPLSTGGFTREWLHTELEKLGVAQENVFIAQADDSGQLIVDLYDDKLKAPQVQTKAILKATLKKCQADLELFAMETKDKKAKNMYEAAAQKMQGSIDALTPLLQ